MMVSVEFLMHHNLPCSLSINFCFYILIHDRIFQISFSCKTWNLMYCHLFPWENRLGRYKQIGSLIVTFVASSSCCLSCLENASARGVTSCEGWFCVPDWGLQAVFCFLPFLLLFFFLSFSVFLSKIWQIICVKGLLNCLLPFLLSSALDTYRRLLVCETGLKSFLVGCWLLSATTTTIIFTFFHRWWTEEDQSLWWSKCSLWIIPYWGVRYYFRSLQYSG